MANDTVKRVTPDEARRRVQSGEALLVCGYESDEKFESMRLEGAISFNAFKANLKEIRREQGIVFYCA